MNIVILLDASRLWRWHLDLLNELALNSQNRVRARFASASHPLPTAVRLGLRLEASFTPHNVHYAFAPLAREDFTHVLDATDPALASQLKPGDLVIDLASSAIPPSPPTPYSLAQVVTPLYNGVAGEPSFWLEMLRGKTPSLALYDTRSHAVTPIGVPAVERRLALSRSAAEVVARLMTGIVKAVATGHSSLTSSFPVTQPLVTPATPAAGTPSPNLALARKVTSFLATSLWNRGITQPVWAVAWRRRACGIDIPDGPIIDLSGYTFLQSDGQRYYADPFLFSRGDSVELFVEELPFATGRGIISVCTLKPDGTTDVPRPVLEAKHHLSYPHVFARDGEIWMLPEGSSSGKLTLYRAARYPDQWEPAADLVDAPLHDATLFEHDGQLWLSAASQGPPSRRWGSSWDSLSFYSAPTLLGPWTAHPSNPVLIDARSARPAGEIFSLNNKLYRPAQDCTTFYGGALAIAEIEKLDQHVFVQKQVAHLSFAPRTRLLGPHTFNRLVQPAGCIEVIDVFGRITDLRALGASL